MGQLAPQGRAVRCFNCHHTWNQLPIESPRPVMREPQYRSARYQPAGARPPQDAYYDSRPRQPAYAGDDYEDESAFAPMMRRPPEPHQEPRRPARPEPKYEPPPAPEPEPERPTMAELARRMAPPASAAKPAPMDDDDLPSDEDLDKMLGPSRDAAASKAFGGAPARDAAPDIDEEEIEKIPDPKPVKQIADEDEDLDELDDDINPEDIPDPDPIPSVYGASAASDDDDDEDIDDGGGSALGKLIAPAIAIVTVGVLIAGLIVGRGFIVGLWPGANDYFYDMIGMHVRVAGDGLERKLIRTAVETVANVDHVIATGTVSNVSDKEQEVPSILVQLLDAKVQVLDQKEIKIEKPTLQPGETVQFRAVFEGAPATARTVRTEWGKFADAAR